MFQMESVESRQMLSGTNDVIVANFAPAPSMIDAHVSKTGTLHVTGTSKADKITIANWKVYGGESSTTGGVYVSLNGEIATTLSKPVKRMSVQGGAGKDIVTIDLKKTITGRLVGGKRKDVLIVVNAPPVNTAVYPFKMDPNSVPTKGLITAYPIADPSDEEKQIVDPNSGRNMFTHAGNTLPVLPDDPRGDRIVTGIDRAWSGKVVPSRPAQLVNRGIYDASLINDLLFYGDDGLTPADHPTSIVITESDGSATAYLYDPTTDKVTVGIEEHFKVHFIDAAGKEVKESIKGQGYLWKMALPDEA